MKFFRTGLIAAIMAASASLPAAALTNADVLSAMDTRIVEISERMTDLQGQLATETDPRMIAAIKRNLQMLNVRRGQLISLKRIVPRYNERLLTRIVTHFDLDVSPS